MHLLRQLISEVPYRPLKLDRWKLWTFSVFCRIPARECILRTSYRTKKAELGLK